MSNKPIPQGNYIAASRTGNLVYTSGMTPREKGVLMFSGKVSASSLLDKYKPAVVLATKNALSAVEQTINSDEEINKIVTLTVYIAAEEGFIGHSKIADFASDYLYERLGTKGIGSRTAIGVFSLPSNALVEIQLVAEIK